MVADEESRVLPLVMAGGRDWLSISITPSFGQARLLEASIRFYCRNIPISNSSFWTAAAPTRRFAIIRKCDPCLTRWVSEPDDRQSAAMARKAVQNNRA